MRLIRGTTPTINVNMKGDVDLTDITAIWVYINQNKHVVIDKALNDVSINPETRIISLNLSQEDTLRLKPGEAIFQIRMLMSNGLALATVANRIGIDDIYKDGVIA